MKTMLAFLDDMLVSVIGAVLVYAVALLVFLWLTLVVPVSLSVGWVFRQR